MLQYLIQVTDNTLIRAFALTVLLLLALGNTRRGGRGFIGWGLLAGAAIALIYAVLKRNTGFMQREYYDLVLTDTARALQRDFDEVSTEMNSIHYEGFTDEEIEQLEGYLERVLANIESRL